MDCSSQLLYYFNSDVIDSDTDREMIVRNHTACAQYTILYSKIKHEQKATELPTDNKGHRILINCKSHTKQFGLDTLFHGVVCFSSYTFIVANWSHLESDYYSKHPLEIPTSRAKLSMHACNMS